MHAPTGYYDHSPGMPGVWRDGEVDSQDVLLLLLPLVACLKLAGSGRAAGDRTSGVTKEAIAP